jgi:hypothetical protein
MITTFEQVETVLNELVEDYLSGLGDNCDSEGNINWGGGVVGYESEIQLIEDLLLYLKNK